MPEIKKVDMKEIVKGLSPGACAKVRYVWLDTLGMPAKTDVRYIQKVIVPEKTGVYSARFAKAGDCTEIKDYSDAIVLVGGFGVSKAARFNRGRMAAGTPITV